MLTEHDIGWLIRLIDRNVSRILTSSGTRVAEALENRVRVPIGKDGYVNVCVYHAGLICTPTRIVETGRLGEEDGDDDRIFSADLHVHVYHATDANDIGSLWRSDLMLPTLLIVAGREVYPGPGSEPYFERPIYTGGTIEDCEDQLRAAVMALEGFAVSVESNIVSELREYLDRGEA